MVTVARRPTQAVLVARVARRYYLEDRSKSEIAGELGISRFRVARLLDTARRDGTVRIEIISPDTVDTALSDAVQTAFGLRHAIVLDLPEDDTVALRHALGAAAGDLLSEIVTPKDVLGIAWARSIQGIAAGLDRIAPCPVVQLTGALHRPDDSDIIDLVRGVARAGGGTPHVFYAPLIAPDAASARMVRRQPDVSRALQLAAGITVAVVGIGAWQPGLSTVFDNVDPASRARAAELGTIGEISGALIDADGRVVHAPLAKRIIGVTAQQLTSVGLVISVAYGVGKAPAIAAALRGKLVNALITHTAVARALLAEHGDITAPLTVSDAGAD